MSGDPKVTAEPRENRRTLTVVEAGRLLGIGKGLAYRQARTGRIPTIRLGQRLVVPRAKLEEMLGEHTR